MPASLMTARVSLTGRGAEAWKGQVEELVSVCCSGVVGRSS